MGNRQTSAFYHIRDIFRRSYHFSCSSDNCPSKVTDISARTDVVNDMTLHAPSNTDYLSFATSPNDKLNNKSPSSSTTKNNINVDVKDDQEISDHLLATALFNLENENAL